MANIKPIAGTASFNLDGIVGIAILSVSFIGVYSIKKMVDTYTHNKYLIDKTNDCDGKKSSLKR